MLSVLFALFTLAVCAAGFGNLEDDHFVNTDVDRAFEVMKIFSQDLAVGVRKRGVRMYVR